MISQNLFPFFSRQSQSAKLIGKGFCGIANFGIENILINPAATNTNKNYSFSFYTSPGEFNLSQLSFRGLSANYKFEENNYQISISQFGDSKYNEQTYTGNFSTKINDEIYFGLNLNQHILTIEKYGNANSASLDLGIILKINNNLNFGVAIQNIIAQKIGLANEDLPQNYSVGINFIPIENTFLEWNVSKETSTEISNRFGTEFAISENIKLRSGFMTEPNKMFGGFSVNTNYANFDYSYSFHRELGETHTYSIEINF